jgi:hypothetical protein
MEGENGGGRDLTLQLVLIFAREKFPVDSSTMYSIRLSFQGFLSS